tara:strand:- start:2053 stop:2424 length:372 start_codon:yes stop_codon:yes gene_type:complete
MKISKKRLIEIIEEECTDVGSQMPVDIDEEGAMAKRQLHDMEQYARELSEMLTDTTQLEAWVQAKLTKAADYLKTVKHYVEYGMEEGAYDQVTPEIDPMEPVGGDTSGSMSIDADEMIKIMRE